MNGGDGCTTLWMYSILLNCTIKNGYDGKCYMYFLIKMLCVFNQIKKFKKFLLCQLISQQVCTKLLKRVNSFQDLSSISER